MSGLVLCRSNRIWIHGAWPTMRGVFNPHATTKIRELESSRRYFRNHASVSDLKRYLRQCPKSSTQVFHIRLLQHRHSRRDSHVQHLRDRKRRFSIRCRNNNRASLPPWPKATLYLDSLRRRCKVSCMRIEPYVYSRVPGRSRNSLA